MVKRRKTMTRRKTAKRRSSKKKPVMKRRLAGFTKTKGKFALVFKRGKKLSLGTKRFGSKKTLLKAATRFAK